MSGNHGGTHANPNEREADTEDPQSKKTNYDQWAVLNQESKRYPISALGFHMLAHTKMCTCTDMYLYTYTHGHAYIWKNKCYLHKTITYLHTLHLFYIYNKIKCKSYTSTYCVDSWQAQKSIHVQFRCNLIQVFSIPGWLNLQSKHIYGYTELKRWLSACSARLLELSL